MSGNLFTVILKLWTCRDRGVKNLLQKSNQVDVKEMLSTHSRNQWRTYEENIKRINKQLEINGEMLLVC